MSWSHFLGHTSLGLDQENGKFEGLSVHGTTSELNKIMTCGPCGCVTSITIIGTSP